MYAAERLSSEIMLKISQVTLAVGELWICEMKIFQQNNFWSGKSSRKCVALSCRKSTERRLSGLFRWSREPRDTRQWRAVEWPITTGRRCSGLSPYAWGAVTLLDSAHPTPPCCADRFGGKSAGIVCSQFGRVQFHTRQLAVVVTELHVRNAHLPYWRPPKKTALGWHSHASRWPVAPQVGATEPSVQLDLGPADGPQTAVLDGCWRCSLFGQWDHSAVWRAL